MPPSILLPLSTAVVTVAPVETAHTQLPTSVPTDTTVVATAPSQAEEVNGEEEEFASVEVEEDALWGSMSLG